MKDMKALWLSCSVAGSMDLKHPVCLSDATLQRIYSEELELAICGLPKKTIPGLIHNP